MVPLVRASAILVGTANILLLAATGAEELEGLNMIHVLLGLAVATLAGLLTAEVVLRLARRALRGAFFSRYAAIVFGVSLGGALTILLPALLAAVPVGIAGSPGEVLLSVAAFTLFGGLAGMIEGLVLAFPLAAFLGTVQRP